MRLSVYPKSIATVVDSVILTALFTQPAAWPAFYPLNCIYALDSHLIFTFWLGVS
jgi:hypothetical protein